MKNRRNIYYLIGSICVLLLAVAFFTYAYFNANTSINNNLLLNVSIEDGISATLTATGQKNVTVDVLGENMLNGSIGQAAGTGDTTIDITLESSMEVACTYDLYFVWSSDTPNQYTKTTGATSNEFTISGNNGTQSITQVQLPNYGAELNLGTFSITTNASATTQKWNFNVKFYNINVNQDAHADKSYKGKIEVKNAECSGGGN